MDLNIIKVTDILYCLMRVVDILDRDSVYFSFIHLIKHFNNVLLCTKTNGNLLFRGTVSLMNPVNCRGGVNVQ